MPSVTCCLVQISGPFQGQGFRFGSMYTAARLNLKGYVETTDNILRIEIEGDTVNVTSFIEWCKAWAPNAGELSFSITYKEPLNHSSFSFRHGQTTKSISKH